MSNIDEDIIINVKLALMTLRPRMRRELRRIARRESGNLTVKEKIENERRERDKYFKKALFNLKTEPFFRKWLLQSRKSMPQILDFLASSFGTMEGFELANRAMRENLNMGDAGVDLDVIEDFTKRASKIALFEFVLLKNNVPARWTNLAMTMFIAKEFGMEKQAGDQILGKQLLEALKVLARKRPESPFPERDRRRREPTQRPAKRAPRKTKEEDETDES